MKRRIPQGIAIILFIVTALTILLTSACSNNNKNQGVPISAGSYPKNFETVTPNKPIPKNIVPLSQNTSSFKNMSVLLKDMPIDGYEIAKVNVEIIRVELVSANDKIILIQDQAKIFNLLSLAYDMRGLLGNAQVPVGKYKQIRLLVGTNNTVIDDAGSVLPLKIPSGTSSGIKLDGAFEVKLGKQIQVILDFDAAKSLNFAPGQGWLLKPVIKIDKVYEYDARYLRIISNELILKLKPGLSQTEVLSFLTQHNLTPKRVIESLATTLVGVIFDRDPADVIDEIAADPRVAFLEPNYVVRAFASPTDNLYGQQWNLRQRDFEPAWDISIGSTQTNIAVLDTGVYAHEDLNGRLLPGYNFIDDSADSEDHNGHGTAVAGIISANTNNSLGIAGVNWRNKILPVKVIDDSGYGSYFHLIEGLVYAADQNTPIINISAGGYAYSDSLEEAVRYATNKNTAIVASVGNDGQAFATYPAAFQKVIAVAHADRSNLVSDAANFGSNVDLVAPGVDITSLGPNNSYRTYTGSSVAAAHVSGLIGLMKAVRPSADIQEITEKLVKASDHFEQTDPFKKYGAGIINAYRTLADIRGDLIVDAGIQSLRIPARTLIRNQQYNIEVDVRNNGSTDLTIPLCLQIDGVNLLNKSSSRLKPGEGETIVFTYAPSKQTLGVVKIGALVTLNDAITGNNAVERQVIVAPSALKDVRIISIWASDLNTTDTATEFRIFATVENNGTVPLTNIPIDLMTLNESNQPIAIQNVILPELNPGEIKQVETFYSIARPNGATDTTGKTVKLVGAKINSLPNEFDTKNNQKSLQLMLYANTQYKIRTQHIEGIHQHMAREALKLVPAGIEAGSYSDYIQHTEYDEDHLDVVYGHSGFLFIDCTTETHFWPVNGDDHTRGGTTLGDFFGCSTFGLTGTANAWEKAATLYTGVNHAATESIHGDNPGTYACLFMESQEAEEKNCWGTFKGATQFYAEGKKRAAYGRLGRIGHLIQDQSSPAHTHADAHPPFADDGYEAWSGWDSSGHHADEWRVSNGMIYRYGQPFRNMGEKLLYVPFDLKPADITTELFPLYYSIYTMNQMGGYFPSDQADGANADRRALLFNYFGMPGWPRREADTSENDWAWHCHHGWFACLFPWNWEFHDNEDLNGAYGVMGDTLNPHAIRATATVFCHFAEQQGEVPVGTCNQNAWRPYSIGGLVVGLTGAGLVLDVNGVETTTVIPSGANTTNFAFALRTAKAEPIALTIVTQPAGQICQVLNPNIRNPGSNIQNFLVKCKTPGDLTPPGPVSSLTGSFNANVAFCSITLAWSNPNDVDFFGGKIVRKRLRPDGQIIESVTVLENNNLDFLTGNVGSLPAVNANTFTDSSIAASQDYVYEVTAVDTNDNFSIATSVSVRSGDCSISIGGGGCFIATAAYGTDQAADVQTLRQFRDQYLTKSELGRAFIEAYYRYSPKIADQIRKSDVLKSIVRFGLKPVVASVNTIMGRSNGILPSMLIILCIIIGVSSILFYRHIRHRKIGFR
ncbi:MAG: S8 family serine peptidase [Spirochaetota bacterium]